MTLHPSGEVGARLALEDEALDGRMRRLATEPIEGLGRSRRQERREPKARGGEAGQEGFESGPALGEGQGTKIRPFFGQEIIEQKPDRVLEEQPRRGLLAVEPLLEIVETADIVAA
jgi:hypothetical protein